MKNRFLRLSPLLLAFSLQPSAFAVDRITALVAVTNLAANLNTITVNGTARTFKTSVSSPSTEIQTAATIGGTATNLWNHLLSAPFTPSLIYGFSDATNITMLGAVGQAMTVTTVGTWATVTYSTQVVSTLNTIRVPGSALPHAERTNEFSLLITGLNDYALTSFAETAIATTNFLSKSAVQTGGNKTLTNSTWNSGYITNSEAAVLRLQYYVTNGGIWFHSTGIPAYAIAPSVSGKPGLYDISGGAAGIDETTAAVYTPAASSILNFRIATNSFGQLANPNTWTRTNTFAQITNSPIVGSALTANTYSGTIVSLSGGLISGTGLTNSAVTNTTFAGTNVWNGDLSFTRSNNSTLANGANSALDFGTAVYVKLKAGPTAAFSIAGINSGPRDGRLLIIDNATAQNLTFADESGLEATAANRIETGTSADVSSTGNAIFILIYDSEISRWKLVSPFEGGAGGSGGGTGYSTIDEEAGALTQRAILNFVGAGLTAADNPGSVRTDVTIDADLSAIAALATTGIPARTAANTWSLRTITAGTGIGVTDGTGVSGNPTIAQTANSVVQKVEVTKNSGAVVGTRKQLNFLEGSNVTLTIADDVGNDQVDVTIASSAGSAGYATVAEEGSALTQRSTLNFIGASVTAADNSGSARTDVTIQPAFATPSASAGLSAIAGSATTSMRSDGAPALDVTISPTWSGSHIFGGNINKFRWTPADATGPYINFEKRGKATDTTAAILSGATLGTLGFFGWDGSTYGRGAYIYGTASENFSGTANGGALAFVTTTPTTLLDVERLRITTGVSVGQAVDPGAGILNALTGYRINNAATSGNYLRGNGTSFLSSAIQLSDLSANAPDLVAVEGISGTGLAARTAANTWTSRTITAGTGISVADGGGVAGNPTITQSANTVVQKIEVTKNGGAVVGTRKQINLIEGAGMTLTIADDVVNDQVDVTITSAGGITSLNGLSPATQTLNSGTSGTDFAIASSGSAHTFNLPTASASNRGALSSANWTTFNNKVSTSTVQDTGTSTYVKINGVVYLEVNTAGQLLPIEHLDLGSTANRFEMLYVKGNGINLNGVVIQSGLGSPNGAVNGAVGSLWTRTDGGAGTTLYVKESGGSGSSGWVAK